LNVQVLMFWGVGRLCYVESGRLIGVVRRVLDVKNDGGCSAFKLRNCALWRDRRRRLTLLIVTLFVFVPAIVELYCDSELCLGNICGRVG